MHLDNIFGVRFLSEAVSLDAHNGRHFVDAGLQVSLETRQAPLLNL
jgi:hypothetical protein